MTWHIFWLIAGAVAFLGLLLLLTWLYKMGDPKLPDLNLPPKK